MLPPPINTAGYTTDVLLLQNGKPDLQFCRSLETGIITMNNEIIRKVGALHDMLISDEHITAVLRGENSVILPEFSTSTITALFLLPRLSRNSPTRICSSESAPN